MPGSTAWQHMERALQRDIDLGVPLLLGQLEERGVSLQTAALLISTSIRRCSVSVAVTAARRPPGSVTSTVRVVALQ